LFYAIVKNKQEKQKISENHSISHTNSTTNRVSFTILTLNHDQANSTYMAILDILVYPDERLRTVARPVETVNDEIRQLVNDMTETMYDSKGIGLAATQVDVHKQVIVIDISDTCDQAITLINPHIIEKDGEQHYDEGCLSVPEYYASVTRAESVKVSALDEQGEMIEIEADGLLATCIQHEIDHLLGKVFVDYLSRLKQDRVRKKLIKRHRALSA